MLTSGGQNQTYFWRTKPDLLLGDKTRLTSGRQNQTYFWGIKLWLLLGDKTMLTSGGQNQTYFWRTKPDLLLGDKTRLTSGGQKQTYFWRTKPDLRLQCFSRFRRSKYYVGKIQLFAPKNKNNKIIYQITTSLYYIIFICYLILYKMYHHRYIQPWTVVSVIQHYKTPTEGVCLYSTKQTSSSSSHLIEI
jgi:hypothetical protein